MPAGGIGDEPYLDIVVYMISVFSEKADNLIRDISQLMDFSELSKFREELLREHRSNSLNIEEFELRLEKIKDDLLAKALARGWDMSLFNGGG